MGEKIYEKIRSKKFQGTNIAAAKAGHKILAPLQYNEMMHSEFFEACFEKHIIPEFLKRVLAIPLKPCAVISSLLKPMRLNAYKTAFELIGCVPLFERKFGKI